ncbi:restriction endonuclease [Runella sp. CRIBMP]|uniref:restriction endonuclease n=1 Tax=Runella sp. CRIBMP TaxID=2683261 RepID=UPI001412A4D4|nr:restriction endonuclease [Runella sp. CRIBMP]NBB18809.1 restriction endonuclease [Runella sp. CRIBMP]
MNTELVQILYSTEELRSWKIKHIAEIYHKGLKEFKRITADERYILDSKVEAYVEKLTERWNIVSTKQKLLSTKEANILEAEIRTKDAVNNLKRIENLLKYTLNINDAVDWEQIKDNSEFKKPHPKHELKAQLAKVKAPDEPIYQTNFPRIPIVESFSPQLTFLDNLFKSRKEKKIQKANELFEAAMVQRNIEYQRISEKNEALKRDYQRALNAYNSKVETLKNEFSKKTIEWEKEKDVFYEIQSLKNSKVDILKENYFKADEEAIHEYCELVLNNSQYPDEFPKSFELDYNGENKILIVEYTLPSIENLPTLSEVKFLRNELKEYFISETQLLKMFDVTMYNITLRTLHELFEADVIGAIEAISFNGWVNAINKATGKVENNCILSIQAKKSEFQQIDLSLVDPKACFKNLKGVGSSKLSGLTAVQPIMQINRSDKRFIHHYDVAGSIDDSTNLAAMDWEDFEHLIREIFSKEFNSNGGEVKVTQASKDGGVDAIAFDPDPIRGGKIVIQAKRYTNTVGVSAVRDLYGTVMNEGATKGILVTTADYGPDAYDFVKGKPLTLMNGANLLYLLEKHGHKAKIDIKEAKKLLK